MGEENQFLLEFFAYDVTPHPFSPGLPMSEFISSLAFTPPAPSTPTMAMTASDLTKIHSDLMLQRSTLPYEIDGVVYKLLSTSHRALAGGRPRSPRWAVAHKFPPSTALTKILTVEPRVGRTGAITPVAKLLPCIVGGVNVTSASLHNFPRASKLLRGAGLGAVVEVTRAGDVIPQVVRVVEGGSSMSLIEGVEAPKVCPACGGETMFEWQKEGGEELKNGVFVIVGSNCRSWYSSS